MRSVFDSALSAKSTFDRGVKTALQAVSLPTTEEVEELRRKLVELEAMLDGLADRMTTTEGPSGPRPDGRSA